MNPILDDRLRQLLPRWRSWATTVELGEAGRDIRVAASLPGEQSQFERHKRAEWAEHQSPAFAADLLATGVVTGRRQSVSDAADALLVSSPPDAALTRLIARRAREGATLNSADPSIHLIGVHALHSAAREAKRRVRNDPRNALAWTDLAQIYVSLGQHEHARRAITNALALAPAHRFVVRAGARFFSHEREYAQALSVLRRCPAARIDPWIAATELAISGLADKPPMLVKPVREMVNSARFSAFHLAEATSALGTLETASGNIKVAKKLFRRSLGNPNENAVAQAMWAEQAVGGIGVTGEHLQVPRSFEARSRLFYQAQDWQASLAEISRWSADQPFSAVPVIQASYVSAVILNDHEQALAYLDLGAISNREDWTLRNNRVFSLASLGHVKKAREVFETLSPELGHDLRHGVWLATAGLLLFREGATSAGEVMYDDAISFFAARSLHNAKASAAFFKAREATLARLVNADESRSRAVEFLNQSSLVEAEELKRQLDRLAADVPNGE